MSRAVDHLYEFRKTSTVDYRIALQIHDAVILQVPIEHIEAVYDTVLPACMTDRVDIWPADLNGMPLRGISEPYHLGIDREVYLRWGEKLTKKACRENGIPERFGKD